MIGIYQMFLLEMHKIHRSHQMNLQSYKIYQEKTVSETFDFRFEFYDVNNNFIPVNVTATKEFDGGNDFPTSGKLFTFESDRNAFRFSSGSIGNPPFQQIQFKTSQQNLTGSVTYITGI